VPLHPFESIHGRIVELHVDSDALRNNLLGDPATRTVLVYLPPGYDESTRDYSWLVDLAGFTGSGLQRVAWKAFQESVPQRLERLVAQGRMEPVIVAFPDGFTSLGGNQYVDSPVLGRWATFLGEDLVAAVEARFRVRRAREHRGIYGKSSGGYGAMVQGMLRSETWAAVAVHSGDMGFEWVYRRELPATLDTLARHGGDPAHFLAHVRAATRIDDRDMHALMTLAMAASYDPAPEMPMGIRLPVDPHTCELDGAAWARWLQHDPLELVLRPEVQASLRRLKLLYLDCGSRDQYTLHYGARLLSKRLSAAGVPHEYEEFDGTHSGVEHRLDVSLPRLAAALV
jgi:enterochelin esterase-like enzyme